MERLTDKVGAWVEPALKTHALGERVTWELIPAPAQTEQGVVLMLLLYLEIPGALVGSKIGDITHMPAHAVTQQSIDMDVKAALDRLFAQRTTQLSATNGHAPGPLQIPGR